MADSDRVTGAAKEIAGKAQGAVGDLVGSERDSAEGRLSEVQGKAENLYGQAKDVVRDYAGEATERASHYYDNAGDYVRQGRRAVGHQVEESPIVALLVAGAVGYGLALLIHSRR
jgi:uncharacterized protein YjbJ (UPF0337 family)